MSKDGDRIRLPGAPQTYLLSLIMLFGIVINFSARHLPGGVEKIMGCWAFGAVVFVILGHYARKKGDRFSFVVAGLLVVLYALAIVSTASRLV